MKIATPEEWAALRADPRFDKPANFDAIVAAAQDAARAAREAGAPPDVVKRSADTAAFQTAGINPRDDPWQDRLDLA